MMKNLKQGLDQVKQRNDYIQTKSIEVFCEDMKKRGFDFSVEKVIEIYPKYYGIMEVDDYFYNKDKYKWGQVEAPMTFFNSDLLSIYVEKNIKANFDVEAIGDPTYIESIMCDLDYASKEEYQPLVERYIKMFIQYSKRTNTHKISGILRDIDFHECFRNDIKKCHNRNKVFKELIKELYDCYDDIDQSVFKIK